MKFYSHKLKLTEYSRLVFNRFFLESLILVNNVSSVILVLIMPLEDHRQGIVMLVIKCLLKQQLIKKTFGGNRLNECLLKTIRTIYDEMSNTA